MSYKLRTLSSRWYTRLVMTSLLLAVIAASAVGGALLNQSSDAALAAPSGALSAQATTTDIVDIRYMIRITANGTTLAGYNSITSSGPLESAAFMDVLSYSQSGSVPVAGVISSGAATMSPLIFTKRVDAATPLISEAMTQGQTVLVTLVGYQRSTETGSYAATIFYELSNGLISAQRISTDPTYGHVETVAYNFASMSLNWSGSTPTDTQWSF